MTEAACQNTSPQMIKPPQTKEEREEIQEILNEIAILKREISEIIEMRGRS